MNAKKGSAPIAEGNVFLVPLNDASYAVGQILAISKKALNSCLCAFFDIHLTTGVEKLDEPLTEGGLIAVQFVTIDLLKKGVWIGIGHRSVALDVEKYVPLMRLEQSGYVGAKIIGSGIIREFLSAYYALRPWDTWHDPNYLDKLLVPERKRPANVMLTKTAS